MSVYLNWTICGSLNIVSHIWPIALHWLLWKRVRLSYWLVTAMIWAKIGIMVLSIFLMRAFRSVPPCCNSLRLLATFTAQFTSSALTSSICCIMECTCITSALYNKSPSIFKGGFFGINSSSIATSWAPLSWFCAESCSLATDGCMHSCSLLW